MASFLEYLYGTNGTEFGRLRHADGHPKPYAQIHFEIGNEEHFDPAYLDRVVATVGAMEDWQRSRFGPNTRRPPKFVSNFR